MGYKFIKTHDPENRYDLTNVQVELPFNDATRTNLVEAFSEFLKACGFHFDNEILDFVEEEDFDSERELIKELMDPSEDQISIYTESEP